MCPFGAVVLTCLLMLSACNSGGDALDVTPGVRIGDIELKASRSEVHAKMGAPVQREGEHVADSLLRDEWVLGDHVIVSALYHEDDVVQVNVEGPGYSTPAGHSGYSSISEIRSSYPDMAVSVMAHDLENMYLDEVNAGIAFSVRAGKEGEATNEDGDVINVFVHPAGKEVIAIIHHHDQHGSAH